MKKVFLFFLILGFVVAGLSGLPARVPIQAENALTVKARALLAAMEKGDFKLAVRDFDETMLKLSGPEKLEPMWNSQLPAQLGAFKKQGAARRDQLQGYEIVLVTCEFEKASLDARVVFDKAGKIAGLGFVPTAPPVKYEPPAYADPAKFEEIEVTVGSGEWALPGTLAIPKGEGAFPALVLVHGSGPNNRDEDLGPNKPFKDLAWGLASRGIAVLRYDKRSKVYGAKIVADPKLEATMTVKDETIDDALAAAVLLKKTKRIDGKRIFILGHSLAKSVKKPMLFLQGGRDYQVQTADLDNWKAALGTRKDVEFRLYPKLNHLFYAGEGVLTPLEYTQKHGSITEEVVTDIAAWIGKY